MTQKTAIQQLIEIIDSKVDAATVLNANGGYDNAIHVLNLMNKSALSLLPTEHEQIEQAFNDGYFDGMKLDNTCKTGSDYFTQKYGVSNDAKK